ncbi:hypothetical protein N7G274_002557 [Stereocaulon virgatum]|uniref:Uncharacterized protein n=1 Tax=Stereocaulon virgatum TaxID=373712 RepID=A0ABR4AG41_9LECA
MPRALWRKQAHADLQGNGLGWTPYSQCGCDRKDHFTYAHTQHLRVCHENATVSFHLPECCTHGSNRPKTSNIIDLTSDHYEHCKCDYDEDFDAMIERGRTTCMVHDGEEPSYHLKGCLSADGEMMRRMRRNDRKLRKERRLVRKKTLLKQQEHNQTIANNPEPQPKQRKRVAPETLVPTSDPYNKCDCNRYDHFESMVSQGKIVHIFDEEGNAVKRLHDCSVHGVVARTQVNKSGRPVLVEKANDSDVNYEEAVISAPGHQYNSNTIASDVMRALGIDPDIVLLRAQIQGRRTEGVSDIADLKD